MSDDECCTAKQLLNFAKIRIAIFNTGLFDHCEYAEDKKSFILEVELEYPMEVNEWDVNYPEGPKIFPFKLEITG